MGQQKSIDLPVANEKDLDDDNIIFEQLDNPPVQSKKPKKVKFGALKRRTDSGSNSQNINS